MNKLLRRVLTISFVTTFILSGIVGYKYFTTAANPTNIVVTEEEATITAYESILPSIVNITTTYNSLSINGQPVSPQTSGGTGFIVSNDGLILTNRHVVSEKNGIFTVTTYKGKEYVGSVLAIDPLFDIAIMKIEGSDLPIVKIANSDKLRIGQSVMVIGNVLTEFPFSVSKGIISGIGRNLVASDKNGIQENLEGMIQTDAPINHGNSGGPLINLKGEVVGINTAIHLGGEALGFSIPINRAMQALNIFKTKGKIIRTFLGVRYQMLTKSYATTNNLTYTQGAYILIKNNQGDPGIVPGMPADKAGLKLEDIILELDGKKLSLNYTLITALTEYNPGDTVKLKILRQGEELIIPVTLGELPLELSKNPS